MSFPHSSTVPIGRTNDPISDAISVLLITVNYTRIIIPLFVCPLSLDGFPFRAAEVRTSEDRCARALVIASGRLYDEKGFIVQRQLATQPGPGALVINIEAPVSA